MSDGRVEAVACGGRSAGRAATRCRTPQSAGGIQRPSGRADHSRADLALSANLWRCVWAGAHRGSASGWSGHDHGHIRCRMRFDVLGIQFDHNVQYLPPCPSSGCTHSYYRVQSNSVVGLVANGVLNVDPRGILYLVGGPGAYDAFAPSAELHLGVGAGARIAVPVGASLRVFAEARWHHLSGGAVAPSQFVPITIGLRY